MSLPVPLSVLLSVLVTVTMTMSMCRADVAELGLGILASWQSQLEQCPAPLRPAPLHDPHFRCHFCFHFHLPCSALDNWDATIGMQTISSSPVTT